ncbi:hypothetical protein ACTWP5_31440 [Streptomyces sp. 4N509B]|uniref:hypothetical protein n=1 Tax=Streptomyces sp. 4N509B TaxID=3457413 RepID=UPI003FD00F3D
MARRRVRLVVDDLRPEVARLAEERQLGDHLATYRFGDGTYGGAMALIGAAVCVPAGIGLPLGPYPAAVRILGGLLLAVPVALFHVGRHVDRAHERGPRVYAFDGGLVTGDSREGLTVRPWSTVTASWRRETVTAPNGWPSRHLHLLEVRTRSGTLLCTLPARETDAGATTLRIADHAGTDGDPRRP